MREAWRATQGRSTHADRLKPGDIVTIDCAGFRHKPWVLHEVRERDDKWRIYVRPVGAEFDFAQYNQALTMSKWAFCGVLPEHYALCSRCGEVPPCAEVWTEGIADAHAERDARYEVAGVCPACEKPITNRQQYYRFDENLYVPLGPTVTFHRKASCWLSAVRYDAEVAKATGREPHLSCGGHHTHHLDNVYECTNATCPGDNARHRSYSRCYVGARCNRPECWALGG